MTYCNYGPIRNSGSLLFVIDVVVVSVERRYSKSVSKFSPAIGGEQYLLAIILSPMIDPSAKH